jgi:hypothetical protein
VVAHLSSGASFGSNARAEGHTTSGRMLLDRVTATNAQIARNMADVQAALPGVQAALTKALMATPGVPQAVARDAVRAVQQGRGTVSIPMIDLAHTGMDVSDRIAAKEKLVLTGRVRP